MKNQNQEKENMFGGGVKWYKEKIVEMINNVEDLGTLQYLHRFLELFLEEWGQ